MSGQGIISIEQDRNFKSKNSAYFKKIPKICKKHVDLSKVNLAAAKSWLRDEIIARQGEEDEIALTVARDFLDKKQLDSHEIALQLFPFIGDGVYDFLKKLWKYLLEAQRSPGGIPESHLKTQRLQLSKVEPDPIRQTIIKLRSKFE